MNKQILSEVVAQFYRYARVVYYRVAPNSKACMSVVSIVSIKTLDLKLFLEAVVNDAPHGQKVAHTIPDRQTIDFDPNLRLISEKM